MKKYLSIITLICGIFNSGQGLETTSQNCLDAHKIFSRQLIERGLLTQIEHDALVQRGAEVYRKNNEAGLSATAQEIQELRVEFSDLTDTWIRLRAEYDALYSKPEAPDHKN